LLAAANGALLALLHEDQNVMHLGTLRRTRFGRLNPGVFLEAWVNFEVLIRNHALSGNGIVGAGVEHHVRFAESPAVSEFRQLRQVGGVALRCARVYPLHDGCDFGVRQPAIV